MKKYVRKVNGHRRSYLQRVAIGSVEQSMTSAISCSTASVRLPSSSILDTLSSESTLVDLALLCTAEGEAHALQFDNTTCDIFIDVFGVVSLAFVFFFNRMRRTSHR